MNDVGDLIASCHAAVYAYGVIAAYTTQRSNALDNQAIYRQLRDALIDYATAQGLEIPAAAAAYELPRHVTNAHDARVVAGLLENAMCNKWATVIPIQTSDFFTRFSGVPIEAALRGYEWSRISYAFPH